MQRPGFIATMRFRTYVPHDVPHDRRESGEVRCYGGMRHTLRWISAGSPA